MFEGIKKCLENVMIETCFPKVKFKKLAFFRGGGVKNWSNLLMDISKKLPSQGGRGQNS